MEDPVNQQDLERRLIVLQKNDEKNILSTKVFSPFEREIEGWLEELEGVL